MMTRGVWFWLVIAALQFGCIALPIPSGVIAVSVFFGVVSLGCAFAEYVEG